MPSNTQAQQWHFARRATANEALFVAQHAGAGRITYFVAPTGTGKSSFIQGDLIPGAQSREGLHPIIAPLSVDRQQPIQVISNAIEEGHRRVEEARSFIKRVRDFGASEVNSLGTAFFQVGVTPRAGRFTASSHLTTLRNQVRDLLQSIPENHKVLLIMDDAGHLLAPRDSTVICAGIRAIAEEFREQLRIVMFLPSSVVADQLFGRQTSPFKGMGRQQDFPKPDGRYLLFKAREFEVKEQVNVNDKALLVAYKAIFQNPMQLNRLMERFAEEIRGLPEPAEGHAPSSSLVLECRASMIAQQDWADALNERTTLERQILTLVSHQRDPLSEESLADYARAARVSSVSARSVRKCIDNLKSLSLLQGSPPFLSIAQESLEGWLLHHIPPPLKEPSADPHAAMRMAG